MIAKLESLDGSFEEVFAQLDAVERVRLTQMVEARFYDYENLYSQYQEGFFSQEYWEQRVVPAIAEWAPRWSVAIPPSGPSGRKLFKEEVSRILQNSQ